MRLGDHDIHLEILGVDQLNELPKHPGGSHIGPESCCLRNARAGQWDKMFSFSPSEGEGAVQKSPGVESCHTAAV